MYQKIVENGYITGIVKGVTVGNITEEEYHTILSVIRAKPTASKGFDYKLREDLTWELYELPTPARTAEDGAEERRSQGTVQQIRSGV